MNRYRSIIESYCLAALLSATALAETNQREVISFSNVYELVARGNPKNAYQPHVAVMGYTNRYDGNGGFFVSTNTVSSTNATTRIFSGVSGWSWERISYFPTVAVTSTSDLVITNNQRLLYEFQLSGTNLVIDPFIRDCKFTPGANWRFQFGPNVITDTNKSLVVYLKVQASAGQQWTNVVDSWTAKGNVGVLVDGLNLLKLEYDAGRWFFSQETDQLINTTDDVIPVRRNVNTFGDSPISSSVGSSNISTLGNIFAKGQIRLGTNFVNYSEVSRNGYGLFSTSDRSVDGVGVNRIVLSSVESSNNVSEAYLDVRTSQTPSGTNAFEVLTAFATSGAISRQWEKNVDLASIANNYFRFNSNGVAVITLDGYGQLIFGPGTTNVLARSANDLLYTNGAATVNIKVKNPAGFAKMETFSGQAYFVGSGNVVYLINSSNAGLQINSATSVTPTSDSTISLGGVDASNHFSDVGSYRFSVLGRITFNGITNTVADVAGFGSPETVLALDVGSTYRRYDGGPGTAFYVKESGTGNTGWVAARKSKSLKLQFPRTIDGTGCTYPNTNDFTLSTFMQPQFSGTAATNVNYCQFAFRVPADLDTTQDLTASLTVALTASDTSASVYTVGMVSIANSASGAGTPANYVTMTVPADASGASWDIENVNTVTLTSWRSNMTANQWCLLRLQRDGSDASTAATTLQELEISYVSTR